MAYKTFTIHQYKIRLGRNIAFNNNVKLYASITCHSKQGERLFLYFLRPDSVNAANTYTVNNQTATMYLPAEQYEWYVDLLRNEKPVFAYVNSNRPNMNKVMTDKELVGEGEG